MSYEQYDNPPALIAQRVGAGGGAIWMLKTADDISAVMASGYLTNAAELGMKAGDKLIHIDTTNGVTTDMTVVAHTNGTASGATTDATGYAVGATSITLASAGTGTILAGDVVKFDGDPDNEYTVSVGDTDVSDGGSLTLASGLVQAIPSSATGITVQSDTLNLVPQSASGVETLTASKTLTAADSGKTLYLGVAGGLTATLPAPQPGLRFKFVVSVAPTTAYVITTNGGDDIMIGGVNELEVDTGDDGPYDDDADTLNFVASVAVVGDYVEMESDGTSWYFNGQTNADGGITTSTT